MQTYKAIKVNGKKIDEHRFIIESRLGKKLGFNHVVHHNDEDKSNNAPSNLKVMTRAAHSRLHMKGKKLSATTIGKIANKQQILLTGAKLTKDDVYAIRVLLASGIKGVQIANQYNVCRATISRIKNGKKWNWL